MESVNEYGSVVLVFQEATVDSNCGGNWNTAKNSKYKGKLLDETRLEVATCRHRLGPKAINMFQGELFGYPLFGLKSLWSPRKSNIALQTLCANFGNLLVSVNQIFKNQ